MTAAFLDRETQWDSLYNRAVDVFDCRTYVTESRNPAFARGAKQHKEKQKKQKQIRTTIDRFREVMSSDNPPQTVDEAVTAIAPLITLILSILFRQFIVELIEWIWEQSQQETSQ